jgi:hypothetical protein
MGVEMETMPACLGVMDVRISGSSEVRCVALAYSLRNREVFKRGKRGRFTHTGVKYVLDVGAQCR